VKFITEDVLRMEYRKEPFVSYEIKKDIRLTPGARQFLLDKQVEITDEREIFIKEGKAKVSKKTKQVDADKDGMHLIRAIFLKTGSELLSSDVWMAQEVFALEQHLAAISKTDFVSDLKCSPCTGIQEQNFHMSMDDCFEITGFHIQLEKGQIISGLHYLRCLLREEEVKSAGVRKDEVNRVINHLSQLICQSCGGKECRKKK